jgi:hypothetical protein
MEEEKQEKINRGMASTPLDVIKHSNDAVFFIVKAQVTARKY